MEKLKEDYIDIDPRLEYMEQIAALYVPDIDIDGETGERYICGTTALRPFINRYNQSELFGNISYESYLANKDIQDTIQRLKIDIDKFWFLFLFVIDYTSDICFNGMLLDGTGGEQLKLFSQTINGNIKKINEFGVTFEKPITISIKVEGKHPIAINNDNAIGYLAYAISNNINEIENHPWMQTQKFNFADTIEKKDSIQIWLFYKLFNDFFNLPRYKTQFNIRQKKGDTVSLNKTLLISRLIYLARISTNSKFENDEDTLKGYIKQYKNKTINAKGKIYL